MVIRGLTFIQSYYRHSFIKLECVTNNIEESDNIIICGYYIMEDGLKSIIENNLNKNIIIDFSTEILSNDVINLLDNFDDLSKMSIYYNGFYENETHALENLKNKGCKLIDEQFFLKYCSQYVPQTTNIELPHKKFLLHIGKLKMPRLIVLGLLSYYDLLKYGYVSFFMKKELNDITLDEFYRKYENDDSMSRVIDGLKKLPEKSALDVEEFNYDVSTARNFNADYYNAVDFVIVIESDLRENVFFITEKASKCILQNKEFILVGGYKSLKFTMDKCNEYFGDKNYLTDWCDTSYDDIKNDFSRIEKIIEIIKKECLR